jgi:uncharacterized YccA/Bax inhibitor family protein
LTTPRGTIDVVFSFFIFDIALFPMLVDDDDAVAAG